MRPYYRAAAFQSAFFLPVPAATAGWFLIVPQLVNASTYMAAAGIMAGFGWVAAVTYMNARPAEPVCLRGI